MKKALILCMIALLLAAAFGCFAQIEPAEPESSAEPTAAQTEKPTAEPAPEQTSEPTEEPIESVEPVFELTEDMKHKLTIMCYTLPAFETQAELTDEYMRMLLFLTYTGGGFDEQGEMIESSTFVVEKAQAEALIMNTLGKEFDVSVLTRSEDHEYCYYEDGKIYAMASDYPDISYEYADMTEKDGVYYVYFDMIVNGDAHSSGTHTFGIVPTDNENGFIVTASEQDAL